MRDTSAPRNVIPFTHAGEAARRVLDSLKPAPEGASADGTQQAEIPPRVRRDEPGEAPRGSEQGRGERSRLEAEFRQGSELGRLGRPQGWRGVPAEPDLSGAGRLLSQANRLGWTLLLVLLAAKITGFV